MQINELTLIYFLFKIILFSISYFNGKIVSTYKPEKVRISHFLPSIVAYTLFAGLRWGRDIDYNLYYFLFNEIVDGTVGLGEYEPIFYFLVKIIGGELGLPWQAFVILMSFTLAFAGCFFLKNFPKYLGLTIPVFFLGVSFAENLARWCFAFSFVLIGLAFLSKNKTKKAVFYITIGFFTHYGFILDIFVFLVLFFYKDRFKPNTVIVLYIFFTFIFNVSVFKYLTDFVAHVNIGSRFLEYQSNASMWLDASKQSVSGSVGALNIITTILIVYTGFKVVSKNKCLTFIYNLACVGSITYPFCQKLELLMRINIVIFLFRNILLAIVVVEIWKNKKYLSNMLRFLTLSYFCYFLFSLTFVDSFIRDEKRIPPYYIWDADGREYLPWYD